MRLGNSNGNNRGKKYFIRGRDDVNPDKVYVEKAVHFDTWFANNYNILYHDVQGRGGVDEDVFNDTFLRMHDLIFYTGCKIKNYKAFFHRAYYTNLIQQASKENRYCNFYDHVDMDGSTHQTSYRTDSKLSLVNVDKEILEEQEAKTTHLKEDIMNYVYNNYQLQDFEIFKMYMDLKPTINYHALAKITGLKYHRIQRTVSTIIMDVKGHKDFHKRRTEMR